MSSSSEGLQIGVCLDGGVYSIWAFHLALQRCQKHLDSLNLIYVAKSAGIEASLGFGFVDVWREILEEDLAHGKALLRAYGHEAKHAGVENLHLFLLTGTDISEKIVNFSKTHNINHLYVGRRSAPSAIDKFLMGSVSKAVMEDADCDVTVVSTRFGPEEIHSSKLGILAIEEEERRRRISAARDEQLQELQAKINEQIKIQLADESSQVVE